MSRFGPPEHVYVEASWYDGPRAGIADVQGSPHRFKSLNDEQGDEYLGTFLVWPIDPANLQLEQEQWRIFTNWNDEYEAGRVVLTSHPGNPGTNQRWDEIEALLEKSRETVPPDARRAKAELVHIERERRYLPSGPAYKLGWRLL